MTMLYSHTGVLARTQKSRKWMDLEMVTVSEHLTQDKYHMTALICEILKKKNGTHELIYKTEIGSQMEKTNMVTEEEGKG